MNNKAQPVLQDQPFHGACKKGVEKKKVQQFHDKDDILVKSAQKMRRVMKKHHMNFESVFNNMDKNADCLVSRGEMRRNFKDAAKMELSTREANAILGSLQSCN